MDIDEAKPTSGQFLFGDELKELALGGDSNGR